MQTSLVDRWESSTVKKKLDSGVSVRSVCVMYSTGSSTIYVITTKKQRKSIEVLHWQWIKKADVCKEFNDKEKFW